MRACSMASGGVFFIPDEIERRICAGSQSEDRGIAKPAERILVVKQNVRGEASIRDAA